MATAAYAISIAAVAAMLAFLLVVALRGRRASRAPAAAHARAPAAAHARAPAAAHTRTPAADPVGFAPDAAGAVPAADPLVRLPWRWALAAGLAAGLVGGFLFALRAGAVLAPLTVLALGVGVNVRRLLAVAAVCIGALPVIYLVFPARDRGGNEFGYPNDLVGAHWVALLAVLCLLVRVCCSRPGSGELPHPDHAVPHQHLANERDPRDEPRAAASSAARRARSPPSAARARSAASEPTWTAQSVSP